LADNMSVTEGSGKTIAADEIASVLYQRTKLSLGADGSATDAVGGAGAVSSAVQRVVTAGRPYETVAASQTAQVLGATGAAGDTIERLIIIPATTSPGNVLLLDSATSITIFAGGASSVTELKPIVVDLGMVSASGAWSVTTGANVSVIGIGSFT
jgi:hypothetical protein